MSYKWSHTLTVSTTQSSIIVAGSGNQTVFQFPFIGVSASDIEVIFTDTSDIQTTLPSYTYSVNLNAPVTGQIWGNGGSVTYPLTGSPIANGTTLTISRILPLTQEAEISNQGNQYPIVTEQALDTLCMEIQQVSARTGQQRGTWVSGATYNFGDVVQDGINGLNSKNYYMCAIANVSTTWTADVANGDWSLVIQSSLPSATLPLAIPNGGTGQPTAAAALTALGGVSLSGSNVYTGTDNFTGASILVPTANSGDNSTKAASTAYVHANTVTSTSPNFITSATLNSHPILTQIVVQKFTTSGTYTPTTGMIYATIECVGGGGGGGGVQGVSSAQAAGAGGGGGGYSRKLATATTVGASQSVTVAASGSAGSAGGGNGGGGGTSSVGSLCVALGGSGGSGANGGIVSGVSGAAAGTGDIAAGGQPGGTGTYIAGPGGTGGAGANSIWGSGSTSGVVFNAAGSGNGFTSTAGYGGGGGGGVASNTTATAAGAAGAAGFVIITEYVSA